MNSLQTVIKFTFMNRFRSRSFIITTLLFAVIISIAVNLPAIISAFTSDEPDPVGMLFTEQAEIPEAVSQYFAAQEKPDIVIVPIEASGSAADIDARVKQEIREGNIDGFLELNYSEGADFPNAVYKSEESMEFTMISKLQTALQAVKTNLAVRDLQLTAEQLAKLNTPAIVTGEQIAVSGEAGVTGKSEEEMVLAYILVYVLIFILFMIIMMYGNLIATEITAEKSSRVMEVLITSVSPLRQMFGKIIGIFLLALLQIAVFLIVAVLNLLMEHNRVSLAQFNISLEDIPISLIAYFLFFIITGFFLFATIFAAVGSLVSRTEDLGQASMPITFLSLAGFYIAIFGLNEPNSALITITSFIPFFAPMIMFLRIGMSDPAWWEILLSIGLLIAGIYFMGWLAAKIYRVGVLMYGKRPSIKEVMKAMKAYKV